jgi:hypothetical protein
MGVFMKLDGIRVNYLGAMLVGPYRSPSELEGRYVQCDGSKGAIWGYQETQAIPDVPDAPDAFVVASRPCGT